MTMMGLLAAKRPVVGGGGGSPVTQLGTPTYSGGFSTDVAKPTGAGSGDYYVIFVNMQDEDSTPPTVSSTGFTNLGTVTSATSSPGSHWSFQVLAKAYTGSEGSSFAMSGPTTWHYYVCTIIEGWDGSTITVATTTNTAVSTSPTVPGLTVPNDDSLGFITMAGYDPIAGPTATGWTGITDGEFNASPLLKRELDSGATGSVAVSTGADTRVHGWMVAFSHP